MGVPARRTTGAYVLGADEIRPGWVLLYGVTFGLQAVICAVVRAYATYAVLWIVLSILGDSTAAAYPVSVVVGYGPLVLSGATLILPLGGGLFQQQVGGRSPSQRERLIYEDALSVLAQADSTLRPPHHWFVLDEPELNAGAYANTLMLTRGLIDSGYLEPVLAHELGHLNSSDARLSAALHRLTTQPRRRLHFPFATLGFLISGGLAVWLLRTPWAAYWRSREYAADQYAAKLGQGPALARFLETNALENDLPVPFRWLTEESHPYSEHRIDRIQQFEGPQ